MEEDEIEEWANRIRNDLDFLETRGFTRDAFSRGGVIDFWIFARQKIKKLLLPST